MTAPILSVIVPVYNEEEVLPALLERLLPVMQTLKVPGELVFVNDGSRDRSLALLLACREKHSGLLRIIDLNGNFGQHMAILAAFQECRGKYVITLDADLQNPPEEIPRVLEALEKGHDVVGTARQNRRDPLFRKTVSWMANAVTNRITRLDIRDYGCMLRGYSRNVVDLINQCRESTTFIPALAKTFAQNPVEIPVQHEERTLGKSKYGIYKLLRLNFDLMTGFSLFPLQALTMLGMTVSFGSLLFVVFLALRRLFLGPEAEGVFTLMGINFFLMGITLLCLGIVGEYVGRIYQEVRRRPRYVIRHIWESSPKTPEPEKEHKPHEA
jgi:undecaprenyl-phosphate 4-deoxy-4-formamido-L-arabinose transferase